jgi:hypothetical protein
LGVLTFSEFTDDDIAAQALTFFADGYETSSTALAILMYDLACNPEVQERLREEVDSVMNKHNGQLNLDIIQEMEYLDMVVQGNSSLCHLMIDSMLEDHILAALFKVQWITLTLEFRVLPPFTRGYTSCCVIVCG